MAEDMTPAECRRNYDLELSKLTHALRSHNQRLEALERQISQIEAWRDEDRAWHLATSATMNQMSRQIGLIFDGVRLLSHVSPPEGGGNGRF